MNLQVCRGLCAVCCSSMGVKASCSLILLIRAHTAGTLYKPLSCWAMTGEITNCEIILKTPPLHPRNTHLHSRIRHTSLNCPDPPQMFMSLKLLTQHSPVRRLDPLLLLLHHSFLPSLPPSLLSLWPMTLPHGKPFRRGLFKSNSEVYFTRGPV